MEKIKIIWKSSYDQDGFELKLTNGNKLTITNTDWNTDNRKEGYGEGLIFHANNVDIFFSKSDLELIYFGLPDLTLLELEEYEFQLKECNDILKTDNKNIKALIIKGNLLYSLNKYEESIKSFVLVLEMDPKDHDAKRFIFGPLCRLKPYEKKLKICDRLLEIGVDVLVHKFNAMIGLKKYEEIINICDKFLANDCFLADYNYYSDRFAYYLNMKGFALIGLKRYEEAVKTLEVALNIVNGPIPDDNLLDDSDGSENLFYCECLGNKGFALLGLKKYKEAIESFDQVLKIFGGNVYEIDYLDYRSNREKTFYDDINFCRDLALLELNKIRETDLTSVNTQKICSNFDTFYLFFDTETTGLPLNFNASHKDLNNWPRVVQLAWILTDSQGKIIEEKSFIIKPDSFTIPVASFAIHGIDNEKANKLGISIIDALNIFNQSLQNRNLILVAHNMDFDINVLGAEFLRIGVETNFMDLSRVCTMKSSIDFCGLPKGKFPKLAELYRRLFNDDFENAHNAMADVFACYRCFFEMVNRGIINLQ